ncbi:protein lethal(2)essential for life-like [Cylas formicarius]|uniref:protein lethal(2)essential for life-like n=1 Tax=Cylas formicarius TaxID=197179 RepID=UPI002958C57F|nr:protein lethal(2)essential for life-like [Cylas formicarius]
MSLLPFFFDEPVYTSRWLRPSRILDQHFGLGLDPEDLFQPLDLNNRQVTRTPAGYLRSWRSNASEKDAGSVVTFDKDKFQANLDVSQFKPEEISVKVADNVLTIEGKHEEKKDEHGMISRHFVRRYVLPKNCNLDKVESKLSSDGVLSITAPKIEAMEVDHKTVPIQQTNEPAKQIEQKK